MGVIATATMLLRRPRPFAEPTDLYQHTLSLLGGGVLDLADRRGQPTLFVNTASKCGYVGQFAGLQALYERYHGEGVEIIGTPSRDFMDQEFETAEQIGGFCQRNYGVTFPLTESMSVRRDPAPLWRDLARQPGAAPPSWNFTKYLVGRDGHLLARFSTKVPPDAPEIAQAIDAALTGAGSPASGSGA